VETIFNRSTIMFAAGLAGFLHELLLRSAERPYLLALCGALMGLPFVLKADEQIKGSGKDDDKWSHLP
jgi:hypothetical protein